MGEKPPGTLVVFYKHRLFAGFRKETEVSVSCRVGGTNVGRFPPPPRSERHRAGAWLGFARSCPHAGIDLLGGDIEERRCFDEA